MRIRRQNVQVPSVQFFLQFSRWDWQVAVVHRSSPCYPRLVSLFSRASWAISADAIILNTPISKGEAHGTRWCTARLNGFLQLRGLCLNFITPILMAIANKFPNTYLLFLIILTQKAKVQIKSKILNWEEKKWKSSRLLQYDWHSFAKGRLSQVITHFQVYPCWETYLTFTHPHHSRKTCPKTPFSHSTALQMRHTNEEDKNTDNLLV